MKRVLTSTLLVCWLLCPSRVTTAKAPKPVATVVFTPTDLFKGELARIEPHLEIDVSGAVELKFTGAKTLSVHYEIWKGGKKVDDKHSSAWPFKTGEITYSLREVEGRDGKYKYRITVAREGGKITTPIDVPDCTGKGVNTMQPRKKLEVKDDESVPIFVHGFGKTGDHVNSESVEEMAKTLEFAVVLRIAVGNKRP